VVCLDAEGKEFPGAVWPDVFILKKVKRKPSRLITKKEAIEIAGKHGMKDTVQFEYRLQLNNEKKPNAYELFLIFDNPSTRPADETAEKYVIRNWIIVNPWTRKVVYYKKEETAFVRDTSYH